MQGIPVPKHPAKSVAEQVTDPTTVTRTLADVEVDGKRVTVVSTITVTNGALSVVYDVLGDLVKELNVPSHNSVPFGDLVSLVNRVIAEVSKSSHINTKLSELR